MLLITATVTFSQQITSSPALTKQDYLQKSKKQKTAAWILLGGGFVLSTTSILLTAPKATEDYAGIFTGIFYDDPAPQNDYTVETILLIGGTAVMLSSIPLFIASGKNKRKARTISASLIMDDASIVQGYSMVHISYPALALKINLR